MQVRLNFRQSATDGIILIINNNEYRYIDSGGGVVSIGVIPTNDVLDHHKIVFDCDIDTFDWYINSMLEVDNGEFKNNVADIDNFEIMNTENDVYSIYIDAFGAPVNDNTYQIGDNYYWTSYQGTFPFEDYNLTEFGDYYGS